MVTTRGIGFQPVTVFMTSVRRCSVLRSLLLLKPDRLEVYPTVLRSVAPTASAATDYLADPLTVLVAARDF